MARKLTFNSFMPLNRLFSGQISAKGDTVLFLRREKEKKGKEEKLFLVSFNLDTGRTAEKELDMADLVIEKNPAVNNLFTGVGLTSEGVNIYCIKTNNTGITLAPLTITNDTSMFLFPCKHMWDPSGRFLLFMLTGLDTVQEYILLYDFVKKKTEAVVAVPPDMAGHIPHLYYVQDNEVVIVSQHVSALGIVGKGVTFATFNRGEQTLKTDHIKVGVFDTMVPQFVLDDTIFLLSNVKYPYTSLYTFRVCNGTTTPLNRLLTLQKDLKFVTPFTDNNFLIVYSDDFYSGISTFNKDLGTCDRIDTGKKISVATVDYTLKKVLITYSNEQVPFNFLVLENKEGCITRTFLSCVKTLDESILPYIQTGVRRTITTPDDKVHTFVYGKDPGHAPVLYLHGGPFSTFDVWYDPLLQYLSACNTTPVLVNQPGSTGYGKDYYTSIKKKAGIKDVEDIVQVARTFNEKAGIIGHSYGGFLALRSIIVYPDLFRAGAALLPPLDMYHFIDFLSRDYSQEYINQLYPRGADLKKLNVIDSLEDIKIPVMIITGRKDSRVTDEDIKKLEYVQKLNKKVTAIIEDLEHGYYPESSLIEAQKKIAEFMVSQSS